MLFIFNRQRIHVGHPVNPDIDQLEFNLDGITDPNFQLENNNEIELFFDNNFSNPGITERFFENFTGASNHFYRQSLWHIGERLLRLVIEFVRLWETDNPGHKIHKGTLFYFWGMGAILRGDIDAGYLLMHQALAEDVRTQEIPNPTTPARAFVRLEYDNPRQAMGLWLSQLSDFLESLLENYRITRGRSLQLSEIKNRFLTTPPDKDTLFLFNYILGRMFLLSTNELPDYALKNNFAGQLEANLLFDLALVIDKAIDNHNPNHGNFSFNIAFLCGRATPTLNLTQSKLQQELNRDFNTNFSQTLVDVIEGRYTFQDATSLTGHQIDLAVAYGLRNYAAHNTASVSEIWRRFQYVKQCLFNSLFFVVETLY